MNLFLLFGAVFAFPAVVINTCLVTCVYAMDLRYGFKYAGSKKFAIAKRYLLYLAVAIVSTVLGACLVKYTPGILHRLDCIPACIESAI
jgi:hypothetical protein